MFEDVTDTEALKAIKELIAENHLRDSRYNVWFHKKLISPSAVITKVYALRAQPIDRNSFTTDDAQKRLLELGFPIFDKEQAFFTKKDLHSFKILVHREKYDKENEIDKNIGYYLNEISWEKTKQWSNKLAVKGWDVQGAKSWNVQNRTHGQAYRNYTWFKILPKERKDDRIFFTIGLHDDYTLAYKIDIKRDDTYVRDNIEKKYEQYIRQNNIRWHHVKADELQHYDFSRLAEECHIFFQSLLKTYYELSKLFFTDKRIMRLTWNSNNWEYPCGQPWKEKNRGQKGVAYENQHGFGHEEWLFNEQFRINGYQYGYIRGFENLPAETELVSIVSLYTIKPDKQRCLVGSLKNVQKIKDNKEEQKLISAIVRKYKGAMVDELKNVNADYQEFIYDYLVPNAKFKWSDAELFAQPIPVDFLDGSEYSRYKAYFLTDDVSSKIQEKIDAKTSFEFKSGKSSNTVEYSKSTSAKSTKVIRRHGEITDDLYSYLRSLTYPDCDISVESTRIGSSIADVVLRLDEGYVLFEVKTSNAALKNIREALGQILEYAFLDKTINVKKLVIVGPAQLHSYEKDYLQRLKHIISVELEYWAYLPDSEIINDKFTVS